MNTLKTFVKQIIISTNFMLVSEFKYYYIRILDAFTRIRVELQMDLLEKYRYVWLLR